MKKLIFLFLICCTAFSSQVAAQCSTLPLSCDQACDLGTLPKPADCMNSDNDVHSGGIASFNLTNVGAIAGNPGTIVKGCAYPGADVWYKFVATGNELLINLTSDVNKPLNNPNINLYSGSSCSSLNPITCFTGTGGVLSTTFTPLSYGTTYYVQISGGTLTDQGNFTLHISNNQDCSKCILGELLTSSPAPVNGSYSPGQTVNFCFTVTKYNQNSSNWLHGVIPSFGGGWDLSTLTPITVPLSCDTTRGAAWGFYKSVTSTFSKGVYGPGFFYETSAGDSLARVDNNPGDNYGDVGVGDQCPLTFCWKITTLSSSAACSGGSGTSQSLSVTVKTTGDSQSGAWSNPGCLTDPVFTSAATLSCCAPPQMSAINTSCGFNNGAAIATGIGIGPWHYTWADASGTIIADHSGKNTADTIPNLAAGQYFVTVSDANSCSNPGVATIGGQPDSFSIHIDSISCSNTAPNGKITITPIITQNAPFTYSLNGAPSQNSNIFSGLGAGTYTIIVRNSFGCPDTLHATINTPPAINIGSPTITPATCLGGGAITVLATGGTSPLKYAWSNNGNSGSITGLAAGPYILTVTDNHSCSVTASYNVTTADSAVTFGTPAIVNPLCSGGATGSITATATGGSGPIKYHWGNNTTSNSINGLSAGTYSVTATDSTGCSATTTYIVGQPSVITIGTPTITPTSCATGGSIQVQATGGTGNLTYTWTPTNNGSSISNLNSGAYKLTVTDQNLCSATATYNVPVGPNNFALGNATVNNVTCNGAKNGSITVTTVGANNPVHYKWSTNATDTNATVTGLGPGTYKVTATDASGCTATAQYSINEPPVISIGNATLTNASCLAGGSISVQAFGGTGQLSYHWSGTSQTTDSVTNLPAGVYNLTITDQNSCSVTRSFNIAASSGGISIGTPVINNLLCNGDNNGSVAVTATGGTGTITYRWGGSQTTSTITGLTGGPYSVTVTDSLGCSATASYSVTQPAVITPGNPTITGSSCSGSGSIKVFATGGTGALSYLWSNGQTTDSIGNLAASSYRLTVTDQNACSVTAIYTVPTNGGLTFSSVNIMSPTCNGGKDGSIAVNATGGSGTIKYKWSTNDSTASVSGLAAGSYSVTAKDANNCSASITYVINNPAPIAVNLTYRNFICYEASVKDTITANPGGGTPDYTYLWSNTGTGSSIIISPGPFSVTVTDFNGCTGIDSGIVRENPQIHNTNVLYLNRCANPANGEMDITGLGGTGPLTYTVTGISSDTSGKFPNLVSGSYLFTITDSVGCLQNGNFDIPLSLADDSFSLLIDSVTCYGFNNGRIIVIPGNPDDGPFQYQMDGNGFQPSDTFSNVGGGNHSIIARNTTFGCTYNLSAIVDQPTPHLVNATPDTVNGNPGELDTLSAITDFQNPVYIWSPASGLSCIRCDSTILTLDSTNNNTYYKVTVFSIEDSTCYASDSVHVTSKLPIVFVMPSAFTPNGQGQPQNETFGPVVSTKLTTPVVKAFRIYNRWGQMVFNSSSANATWDGKYNGSEEPVGTYVYYIEVQFDDPNSKTGITTYKKEGSVTLLR